MYFTYPIHHFALQGILESLRLDNDTSCDVRDRGDRIIPGRIRTNRPRPLKVRPRLFYGIEWGGAAHFQKFRTRKAVGPSLGELAERRGSW